MDGKKENAFRWIRNGLCVCSLASAQRRAGAFLPRPQVKFPQRTLKGSQGHLEGAPLKRRICEKLRSPITGSHFTLEPTRDVKLEEFDENLFGVIVDHIVLKSTSESAFVWKNGMETQWTGQ